jgi:hypothetical protein
MIFGEHFSDFKQVIGRMNFTIKSHSNQKNFYFFTCSCGKEPLARKWLIGGQNENPDLETYIPFCWCHCQAAD